MNKVAEGRPHIVDMIKNGEIAMIVNTTDERRGSIQDSYSIRRSALQARVTYFTTVAGARAACAGMQHMQELRAYSVQSLHGLAWRAAAPLRPDANAHDLALEIVALSRPRPRLFAGPLERILNEGTPA